MEASVINAPRIDLWTFTGAEATEITGTVSVREGVEADGVGAGAGVDVPVGTAGGKLVGGAFVAAALISPGPGMPVFVSVWAGRRFAAEKKSPRRITIRYDLPPYKDVKKVIS
jgi:hypothetical protein